jgi:hypothetical protein
MTTAASAKDWKTFNIKHSVFLKPQVIHISSEDSIINAKKMTMFTCFMIILNVKASFNKSFPSLLYRTKGLRSTDS